MTASQEKQRLQETLQRTAQEYSDVFDIDLETEKLKISCQVEKAGRNLKHQQELFDETAAAHKEVLQTQLPQLYSYFETLQQQFDAFDALEALVSRAATDVTRLEAAMTAAEQQLLDEAPTITDRLLQPVIRKLDPVPENGACHKASYDSSLLFDPSRYLIDCAPSAIAVSSNESNIHINAPLSWPETCVSNNSVGNIGHASRGYPCEVAGDNVNPTNELVEKAFEATDFVDRLCDLQLGEHQTRKANLSIEQNLFLGRREKLIDNDREECIELLDEDEVNTS